MVIIIIFFVKIAPKNHSLQTVFLKAIQNVPWYNIHGGEKNIKNRINKKKPCEASEGIRECRF